MKNKHKDISLFSIYFLLFYALLALATTQIIPYLSDIGYNPIQRSIMLATGSVLGIILQIIIGYLSDKHKTIKKLMIIVLLLFGVSTYFFFNHDTKMFIYHYLLLTLSHSLHGTSSGFSDSWVMESGTEVNEHYGLIRGFGSLGWIFGTIIVSKIISNFGYQPIANATLLLMILVILIAMLLKDSEKKHSSVDINIRDIKILLEDKRYVLAVIILFFFSAITTLDSISVIDKILMIGGDQSHIALRFVIMATVEIPFFFFGKRILKRFGYFKLLTLSGTVYLISHLIMGFTANPMVIVSTAFVQGFCFSPFLLVNRNLIFDLSPDNLKSTGQLFANAMLSGLTGLIIPLTLGYITTNISPNVSLYAGSFFALCALILIPQLKNMMDE